MFIIKFLSQHVSDIIMPIFRRTRLCTTAYGVPHWLCWLWLCGAGSWAVCTVWKLLFDFHTVHTAHDLAPHNHSQHNQCRTPYVVVHALILLMMGIMVPETCWDRHLTINISLVASCWFRSPKSLKKMVDCLCPLFLHCYVPLQYILPRLCSNFDSIRPHHRYVMGILMGANSCLLRADAADVIRVVMTLDICNR